MKGPPQRQVHCQRWRHHSPEQLNLSPIMEEIVSASSHGVVGDIHLLSMYETQLFQMFTDMRGDDEVASHVRPRAGAGGT